MIQSVHVDTEQVIKEVENCGPFGCETTTSVDQEATQALKRENPLGRFAGFTTYLDRRHLAVDEVRAVWGSSQGTGDFFKQKTAYEISLGLVGSEMCIRDSPQLYTILLALSLSICAGVKSKSSVKTSSV